MAFLPNGARVVSGSDDRTVWIWDATMGTEVMKMEGHRDWVWPGPWHSPPTAPPFNPEDRVWWAPSR